jgi:carotenoid cleavage dioxygenase
LQGINAPVFQELDLDRLDVTGNIPPDLVGMYIRNGPNPMFQPIAYNYPLEGDGMLHAVYFNGSEVRYRNRWIMTRGLIYEMAAGKALSELKFRNYANTNLVAHAGKLLALYETGLPYRITPDLETVGEWTFPGGAQQSMTAHPQPDPQTGELHFYQYSFFTEPYLIYYIADAQGLVTRKQPIDLPRPALLHDMAITENYAIFFHCPLVFDLRQAMRCGNPFVWQPDLGTRIGLIHRHDARKAPIWIETDPFWVWHFMNAFEENGNIQVDVAYYPQMKLGNNLSTVLSNKSSFQRVTINPTQKTAVLHQFDDRNVDFPTINLEQTGQPYQFGYMPHLDLDVIAQKGIPNYVPELMQYDVVNQTHHVHRFKPGCYGSEAVVAPKPNGASASDHYVMVWAFDENRQASDLVIIDAADFTEPIATIHLPVRVPMGLHGRWIPPGALSEQDSL